MDSKILSFPDGESILDKELPIAIPEPEWGMRDNFAVATIQGLLSGHQLDEVNVRTIASDAFLMADMMMEARKK